MKANERGNSSLYDEMGKGKSRCTNIFIAYIWLLRLFKESLNASKPSEHPIKAFIR